MNTFSVNPPPSNGLTGARQWTYECRVPENSSFCCRTTHECSALKCGTSLAEMEEALQPPATTLASP